MQSATVLLIDDQPLFSCGFTQMARVLRPHWILHTLTSAEQAMNALDHLTPDLAIISVALPDENGFTLLFTMAARRPNLRLALISERDDALVRFRGRAGGASAFIFKTSPPAIIVSMIDAVLRNDAASSDSNRAGVPLLTARQAEVLTLLAAGHSNKEICHRLGIAERTVRAHLTELFNQLGATSRMQAVIRARELGLIR